MKNNLPVFIVEDDPPVNSMLCMYLEKQGFTKVRGFNSSEEMLSELTNDNLIVIQDYDLPGMNGLETIRKVKGSHPKADFIFLSGQKSIEIAIEAIKCGAFDYIVKDSFAKENVLNKINNLVRIKSLEKNRDSFKKTIIVFLSLLFLSWMGFLIYLLIS